MLVAIDLAVIYVSIGVHIDSFAGVGLRQVNSLIGVGVHINSFSLVGNRVIRHEARSVVAPMFRL